MTEAEANQNRLSDLFTTWHRDDFTLTCEKSLYFKKKGFHETYCKQMLDQKQN